MVRLITNTRRLDALRNVLKNKTSYLSVMLIAFLGVTAFLSMEYAAFSLRRAGSDAYNEMNFRDIEVVSPLMLGEEDFETIKNIATEENYKELLRLADFSTDYYNNHISKLFLFIYLNILGGDSYESK